MDDEIGTIERSTLDGNAKVVVISDSVMTKTSRILLGEYPIKAQYKYLLHWFLKYTVFPRYLVWSEYPPSTLNSKSILKSPHQNKKLLEMEPE